MIYLCINATQIILETSTFRGTSTSSKGTKSIQNIQSAMLRNSINFPVFLHIYQCEFQVHVGW